MHKLGRLVQFAIVGFLIGVALAEFLPMYWPLLLFLAAFCFCLVLFSKNIQVKRVTLALTGICVGVLFLWIRTSHFIPFQGYIESDSEITSSISVYDDLKIFQITMLDGKRLTAKYTGETQLEIGDHIFLRGKAGPPKPDKIASLYMSGSIAEIKVDRLFVLNRNCQHISCKLLRLMSGLREEVQMKLKQNVPHGYGGVADALLFGGAGGVSADIKQVFKETGLSHVLAVSGFNITIVLGVLGYLRKYFDKKILLLIFVSLCIYCIMSGLSASVVRAAIMGSVFLLGIGLKRLYISLHALLLAAFVMVAYNPLILLHDLSFQLSFLATLGILMFHDLFQIIFWFLPKEIGIRSAASSTSSAVLLTLPLQIQVFSALSLVVLPANLLTFSLIPALMLFSFLSLLPVIGSGFGYVFSLLFSIVLKVLNILTGIPHAYIHVTLPLSYSLLSYIGILVIYFLLSKRLDVLKGV